MKKSFIVVCVLFAFITTGAFAASGPDDFLAAIRKGDYTKAEKILKNDSRKWNSVNKRYAWTFTVLSSKYISNSGVALRAAQFLHQYDISNTDCDVTIALHSKRSEELVRYLVDIGMPMGEYVVDSALDNSYNDSFVQYLIDKNAPVDGETLQTAAQKRQWKLVPLIAAKLNEDDMSFRYTRADHSQAKKEGRGKSDSIYDPTDSKTALMWAAEAGQMSVVRLLVDKGAKVNLRADDGATAASLAYDNGEIEIYNYLKSKGAVDFEQKQVVQAPAPAQQSYSAPPSSNSYSAPAQSAPAPSAPAAPAAPQYNLNMFSQKDSMQGTYRGYNAAQGANITLFGETAVFLDSANNRSTGSASISGSRLTIFYNSGALNGRSFNYNIDSASQFSSSSEVFRK